MCDFSNYDFENVFKQKFEEDFVDKILEYISNINFDELVLSLVKNIKKTVLFIEYGRETKGNEVIEELLKNHINLVDIKGKLSFKHFMRIITTIPAFIPIVLMFLKTNVYLNKVSSRNSFVNAIQINIDKTALQKELWENNMDVGSFFDESYETVFPTIYKEWKKNPNVREKCQIISFVYLAFEKAVYLPIEKMEDRLIMDINTLLDTYFYTEEDKTSYDFCGGPRMILDASDKLQSIMKGNVYKPDKYKRRKAEKTAYINGYTDYGEYKFWYKRLKYILGYLNPNIKNNLVRSKYKKLDFYKNQFETLEKDYKFFAEEKKDNLLNYVLSEDSFLHGFLTLHKRIKDSKNLINYIKRTSEKTFALDIIQYKYDELAKKSHKRIQNKFTEFNRIVKSWDDKYNTKYKETFEKRNEINYFLESYYNDDEEERRWELDDKEGEIDELENFVPNFNRLYNLFQQYLNTPSEVLYNAILEQVDYFISSKLSRNFLEEWDF